MESDRDLGSAVTASPTLYQTLYSDERNCVWRQRFLAQYDFPMLQSTQEFPFAYKLRQFVLRRFDAVALGRPLKHRSGHQLDVVKDIVLGNVGSFCHLAEADTSQKPIPGTVLPRPSLNIRRI